MGTFITNKIITRGFGAKRAVPNRNGPIVQGYGGPPRFVVEAIERGTRLRLGQSGGKRRLDELDEVIVWAKLLEINGKTAPPNVKGWIKVKVDKDRGYAAVMAEHISSRTRAAWEIIKVTVQRLK